MKSILLVEDEGDLREQLAEILGFYYQVSQTKDGLEAWQLFEEYEFDLVITDIGLPKIDGMQLIGRIRNLRSTQPILVLSGVKLEQSHGLFRYQGVKLLTKPVDIESLLKIIFETIGK